MGKYPIFVVHHLSHGPILALEDVNISFFLSFSQLHVSTHNLYFSCMASMFSCIRPHTTFILVARPLHSVVCIRTWPLFYPHATVLTIQPHDPIIHIVQLVHDPYGRPDRPSTHSFRTIPKSFRAIHPHSSVCPSRQFGRIRPSRQFITNYPNHYVLQTHNYKLIGFGFAYILLDPMLSSLCGISHSSVSPIFSNFILT